MEPIVNGPGDDFVFFDFLTGLFPTNNPDSFIVSAFAGVKSLGTGTVGTSNYTSPQVVLTTSLFAQDNPLSNLAQWESRALNTPPTSPSNPRVNGGSFDLSMIGVDDFAIVTGLFFQSSHPSLTFDPVFIAGLPPVSVPEPGTALLVISAGLLALRFRARRQH